MDEDGRLYMVSLKMESMTDSREALPEYDAPPVNEVALGISFVSIPGFQIPHFGLYWETIRGSYPKYQTLPAMPTQLEWAGHQSPIQVQFSQDPNLARCWFLDESGTNLIQLQPDRFIRNWRQSDDKSRVYPRYVNLRPTLQADWDNFIGFLAANGLDSPRVIQSEITYVNTIERGEGWETFADLKNIITFCHDFPPGDIVSVPESLAFTLAYPMGKPSDKLRISIMHVIRPTDGKEGLQFNLSAKMKPDSDTTEDILASIDNGRDYIVRAFTDLTTSKMHALWKRKI